MELWRDENIKTSNHKNMKIKKCLIVIMKYSKNVNLIKKSSIVFLFLLSLIPFGKVMYSQEFLNMQSLQFTNVDLKRGGCKGKHIWKTFMSIQEHKKFIAVHYLFFTIAMSQLCCCFYPVEYLFSKFLSSCLRGWAGLRF